MHGRTDGDHIHIRHLGANKAALKARVNNNGRGFLAEEGTEGLKIRLSKGRLLLVIPAGVTAMMLRLASNGKSEGVKNTNGMVDPCLNGGTGQEGKGDALPCRR